MKEHEWLQCTDEYGVIDLLELAKIVIPNYDTLSNGMKDQLLRSTEQMERLMPIKSREVAVLTVTMQVYMLNNLREDLQ